MKMLSKSVRFVSVMGVMLFAIGVGSAWAAEVTLVPLSDTISQGETVTVAVNVHNAAGLRGYQLDVKYRGRHGKLVKVDEGDFLKSDGTGTFFLPPKDKVAKSKNKEKEQAKSKKKAKTKKSIMTLAGTRIGPGPGVSGSGTLALLTFQGTEKAGEGKPVKSLRARILQKSVILVKDE